MLRFVEVCPRCGEPVAAEARFCPACGAGLRPAAATRAAVNTGEAVVSIGPGHESGAALALGDVVNTASRLQTAAPPGRLGTPSGRWEALAALAQALYATGDDDAAASAYLRSAEVIRAFAESLTKEHSDSLLAAPHVREILSATS